MIIAIHQGLLIPYFSAEILEEYRDVLLRPRFGFLAEEVQALVNLLQHRGALLNPPPILRISPDPGDDKFIACAVAAEADS